MINCDKNHGNQVNQNSNNGIGQTDCTIGMETSLRVNSCAK
ncbi:hypothetical protein GMMP1_70012 [Candidatus Magnetomoraceae bacterium gMMP-1]